MEGRNATFQKLKPPCVGLSQASIALNKSQTDLQIVTASLEGLKRVLDSIKPGALDAKLADYVFFPLSQVLKASQKLSIQCLELSLECIAILIAQGWGPHISPQLAAQVAILCTLMAERKPKGFGFAESTNELQIAASSCLQQLFTAAGTSRESRELLTSEAHFPQLGQTISVMLDGINDSAATEVQLAATHALTALINQVADREVCASFLPGIVSKLTKILTPSTKQRRNHRVLTGCLELMIDLLRDTLGNDERVDLHPMNPKSQRPSIIDAKWKNTAATQLKPALESIMKLKTHDRVDVKAALAKLCLVLVERCRDSLANCVPLALDTLITVVTGMSEEDYVRIQLEMLIRADQSIIGLLQTVLHDGAQSLPTVMQSSDETAKLQKLQHIRTTYDLLVGGGAGTATIERMLASSLRDSVVVMLVEPDTKQEQASPLVSPVQSLDLTALHDGRASTNFSQPLVKYRGQEEAMRAIEDFAREISRSNSSTSGFLYDLARAMRYSADETQIANFWLLLTAVDGVRAREDAIGAFIDLGNDDDVVALSDHLEEIYSFALDYLTSSSDQPSDPRLQALALRALALRAETAGHDFRYELVDALYPVLHTLATPDENLQRDSIATLNTFSTACGYASVKDLIVENVDYLTNAVALKLNAFDVSPQAPQVLLMMVRLAGPSLLPYLEDTVESIFAALEDFHGYPLLVELLFRVLGVVAEEGAKAPLLAIAGGKGSQEVRDVLEERWMPKSVQGLAELLKSRKEEVAMGDSKVDGGLEPHPQHPWKAIEEVDEEPTKAEDDEETLTEPDQQLDDADPPPPAPKTYNLLLKITELTQHFLPSASPSLRTSLLALIRTTVPAIARHENSFLPLINTLWPEIVSRLDDEEPAHVKATALEIVGVLCEYAGDFMRTRIVDLWPALTEMYAKTAKDVVVGVLGDLASSTVAKQKDSSSALAPSAARLQQALSRMSSSAATYRGDTSSRLMWEALIVALTTIVEKVPLPPEMFDESLEMLRPCLKDERVRKALEDANADAVWLVRVKMGDLSVPTTPVVPEGLGWRFAEVVG